MTDLQGNKRVQPVWLTLLVAIVGSVLMRWGYWGYSGQLFICSMAGLVAFWHLPLPRSLVFWLLALCWYGTAVIAAINGPQHQLFTMFAEAFAVDAVLLAGVALGIIVPQLPARILQRLVFGMVAMIALLAVSYPFITAAPMWGGVLPGLYGRQPHLLGSTEALELGVGMVAFLLALNRDGHRDRLLIALGLLLVLVVGYRIGAGGVLVAGTLLLATTSLQALCASARFTKMAGPIAIGFLAMVGLVVWWRMPVAALRREVFETAWQSLLGASGQWPGYGRGAFDLALMPFAGIELDFLVYEQRLRFAAPDSFLSGVLVERGLPGVVVLILASIAVLVVLYRSKNRVAPAGALLGLAALAVFSDLSYVPALWLVTGMVIGRILVAAGGAEPGQSGMSGRILLAPTLVALLGVWHMAISQQRLEEARDALTVFDVASTERALLAYTGRSEDHSDGWYAIGNVRLGEEDENGAIDAYRRALELNPRLVSVAEQLTAMYIDQSQSKKAADMVAYWFPTQGYVSERVLAAGAYALALETQNARAMQVAEFGLSRFPDSMDIRRIRARLLMVAEDWGSARLQWEDLLADERATEQDQLYHQITLEQLGLVTAPTP